MNATTKLTFCMLSATALSAVVLACTTTSTFVDDTDGGTVITPDAGPTCQTTGQKTAIGGESLPKCQPCLETSCCSQLQQCYNIVGGDSGTNENCESYSQCISGCNDLSNDLLQTCFDACDNSAAPGVVTGYKALQNCAATSCSTTCEVLDGGHH